MKDDLKAFAEQLQRTPPRCLADLAPQPSTLPKYRNDNPKSVWKLTCRCGSSRGRLLGYALKDYAPDYGGPPVFVSPLGFECSVCPAVTQFLDTDIHGYHSEVSRLEGGGGGSKIRGSGPWQAFECPKCQSDVFIVTVAFVFWDIDELAQEFDGNWEDLFNEFLCFAVCAQCGHVALATDFGKL